MINMFDKILKNEYFKIITIIALILITLNYIGYLDKVLSIFSAILPVVFAVIISYLVEPIILYFERKKVKRTIIVFAVYFIILLLIGLLLYLLIPRLITQLQLFIEKIPILIDSVEQYITKINLNINLNGEYSCNNPYILFIIDIIIITFNIFFISSLVPSTFHVINSK